MFDCKKHGIVENGWCNECEEIVQCDCSDITKTRVKDIIIDSKCGEKTVTIFIEHCATCGAVTDVHN